MVPRAHLVKNHPSPSNVSSIVIPAGNSSHKWTVQKQWNHHESPKYPLKEVSGEFFLNFYIEVGPVSVPEE